eukprot:TRINITY_DN1376_c0_g1_i4.p2 TRINITY_DN1376_c0_g1~~TRINITY_DN1376_c0_g1_i4.p2  ORF type:complete len:217 (+),score=114.24 TRINITY_DN1376_c0_g1_i4:90-740(+)
MSKINAQQLAEAFEAILGHCKAKQRSFTESVELHVNLKNYDTQKDKRFQGTIGLPNVARPTMTVCVIADAYHLDQCAKQGVPSKSVEDLKKFNKNKKLVKKMCQEYDAFLASDSLIKTIPRIVGPTMNRVGKFPTAVAQGDDINAKIVDVQSTVKFQLKKVLNMGTVVGHAQMDQEALRINTLKAINFLVSLLKKNWQNVKSLYIKSTFGPPQRIY